MISIELPWPPTGNHAYTVARGRKILSSAGRAYRDLASSLIRSRAGSEKVSGKLAVVIEACPPDRRVRDLDNLIKLPIDCVKRAGVIADDGDIDVLSIWRGRVIDGGKLWITIKGIEL